MQDPTTIGILVSAVVALWGWSQYLQRQVMTRSEKRIDTLEHRQDDTLDSILEMTKSVLKNVEVLVDLVKELRLSNEITRRSERQ